MKEHAYRIATTMNREDLEQLLAMLTQMLAEYGLATEADFEFLKQLGAEDMAVQLSFDGRTSTVSPFDSIKHEDERGEYWLARELQGPLGYIEWRKFQASIERARIACKNSGYDTRDHFGGTAKMVRLGSSAQRELIDYRLSRYACYLIAMNGDPRKQAISDAQTYFAVQTRRQEVADEKSAGISLAHQALAMAHALVDHEDRLADLEAWRNECQAIEASPALPAAAVDAPDKPTRAALNQLVRSAARRRGAPHSFLWNALYREFTYRTSHDVTRVAKNRDVQVLDIVEELGLMDVLYAIALELYGED